MTKLSPPVLRSLVLACVACVAVPAFAAQQLDWDAQAYTSGSLSGGPYTLGNGTVSVAITGDTGNFNNGTPDDINSLVDGGTGQQSLTLSTDYVNGSGTHEVTVTFTFTHPNGVRSLNFNIFDIDFGAGSFIDQVEIYAITASGTVYPTLTPDPSYNTVSGANSNIVTGTAAASGSQGTVGVSFAATGITSLVVIYRNTIASNLAGQQYMGIHDINFTPEEDLSTSTKTVVDQNGGNLVPGDTLRYTVTVNNAGGVAASGVTVRDDVPAGVSGYSIVSTPGGSTDNSTAAPTGANATGLVKIDNVSVAAGGSATVVFDVTVSGSATTGTAYDNAAQIFDTVDDIVVNAPTMFVNAPTATGTVKQLYLDNAAGTILSRTRSTSGAGTTVAESGNVNFDMNPITVSAMTLAAGTIPITLRWACTGTNTANRSITATLSTTTGTVVALGNQNQTINCPGGALNTFGTSTFNIVLAGTQALATGTTFRLNIAVGAGSGTRSISVRPLESGVYSRVDLNVLTVINVNTLGAYTAAYAGGVLQSDYLPSSTVYLRAVIGDPFGPYDISPAGGTVTKITIKDATGATVITNASMTLVNTGTSTKTYEYAYALAANAPPGNWTYTVTAYEGVEGTVTDALAATYRVVAADISVAKSSAVITDPSNCTGGSTDPTTCGANNPKRIPGAVIRFTITITNSATATATATSVFTTDTIPATMTYKTGTLYRSADATCNTADTLLSDAYDAADDGSISGSIVTFGDSNGGTDRSLATNTAITYCFYATIN